VCVSVFECVRMCVCSVYACVAVVWFVRGCVCGCVVFVLLCVLCECGV